MTASGHGRGDARRTRCSSAQARLQRRMGMRCDEHRMVPVERAPTRSCRPRAPCGASRSESTSALHRLGHPSVAGRRSAPQSGPDHTAATSRVAACVARSLTRSSTAAVIVVRLEHGQPRRRERDAPQDAHRGVRAGGGHGGGHGHDPRGPGQRHPGRHRGAAPERGRGRALPAPRRVAAPGGHERGHAREVHRAS